MLVVASNPSDPQARIGLERIMDALKRMELVWPSAGRAWELLHGAKDGLDAEGGFATGENTTGSSMAIDRPKKRGADDILADIGDTTRHGDVTMDGARNIQQSIPSQQSVHQQTHYHQQQQQAYGHEGHLPRPNSGVHQHSFVQPYSSTNTSPSTTGPLHTLPPAHHAPAPAAPHPTHESPLAFFSSYDRWSSENQLGFPAGLSTSVLPAQYSTGFVDDRSAHASAANASAGAGPSSMHRLSVDTSGASAGGANGVGGSSRYPQYWNDYNTLGQPASMLGSMYGMGMLTGAAPSHQSTHSQSQSHSPSHSHGGQGHGHGHSHGGQGQPQGGQGGMFMGDHYDMFGE